MAFPRMVLETFAIHQGRTKRMWRVRERGQRGINTNPYIEAELKIESRLKYKTYRRNTGANLKI